MHRIRLRDPWQVCVKESATSAAEVVYSRRFNCPTGLDPNSRLYVALQLTQKADSLELRLNGTEIGSPDQSQSQVASSWESVRVAQAGDLFQWRIHCEPGQNLLEILYLLDAGQEPPPFSKFASAELLIED